MQTNDSLGLSPEERLLVDAGVDALSRLTKRTFEDWMHIARALQMLKEKPGGDNRKRWLTMREEAGFGAIDNAVVCRLLKIMEHEDEVVAWHAALPASKQLAWCSPASVMRKCPHLARPAAPRPNRRMDDYDKLQTEHGAKLNELHRLEQQVRAAGITPQGPSVLVWKVVNHETMQAKVDGGLYQTDLVGRGCDLSYFPDDAPKEELEVIGEIVLSEEEILRLCLERAQFLAEEHWAWQTANTAPASEGNEPVARANQGETAATIKVRQQRQSG